MNPTSYIDEPGLSALLDGKEKKELAILARKAFAVLDGNGATDESFDEFRHRIAMTACGRRISEALRGDYSKLEAAFAAIAGQTSRAFRAGMRDSTAGKRVAEAKLRELLATQGRDISYTVPLFRNFYKTTLADATAKQVWAIFYELQGGSNGLNKNRVSRRRSWKKRTGGKETTESRWQP